MKRAGFLAALLAVCAPAAAANPPDLTDRLRDTLFARTTPDGEKVGSQELDILFWESTKHLLTSPSHELAVKVLDDFIRGHGERAIRDTTERALLQRDLWALFDWSANYIDQDPELPESRARREIQRRLATVIERLALSADEINRLPDNYAEAEPRLKESGLPQGLLAADSPWLLVGRDDDTTAREHTAGFGGRSVFLVFVKFPDGRQPALRYLKELREFVPALVYSNETNPGMPNFQDRQQLGTNRTTPQFPAGTQWALVRRLCLVDNTGKLRATRIVESIQTRTYASIPEADNDFDALRSAQTVAEFQMSREHRPALRAVEKEERDFQFVHFRSMGGDPFEQMKPAEWDQHRDRIRGVTLRTCMMCHVARGILSVNTYAGFGRTAPRLDESNVERETSATLHWKSRQFEWGLLKGLWTR